MKAWTHKKWYDSSEHLSYRDQHVIMSVSNRTCSSPWSDGWKYNNSGVFYSRWWFKVWVLLKKRAIVISSQTPSNFKQTAAHVVLLGRRQSKNEWCVCGACAHSPWRYNVWVHAYLSNYKIANWEYYSHDCPAIYTVNWLDLVVSLATHNHQRHFSKIALLTWNCRISNFVCGPFNVLWWAIFNMSTLLGYWQDWSRPQKIFLTFRADTLFRKSRQPQWLVLYGAQRPWYKLDAQTFPMFWRW